MPFFTPSYLNTKRFSSFKRQLSVYKFARVMDGPEKGAYYNEFFLRGRPDLLASVKRIGQRNRSSQSSSPPKVHHRMPQAKKHRPPTPSFRLYPRCRELTREEIRILSSVSDARIGQDRCLWDPELVYRVKKEKEELESMMRNWKEVNLDPTWNDNNFYSEHFALQYDDHEDDDSDPLRWFSFQCVVRERAWFDRETGEYKLGPILASVPE